MMKNLLLIVVQSNVTGSEIYETLYNKEIMLIFDKGGVKGKFLFPPNKAWKM